MSMGMPPANQVRSIACLMLGAIGDFVVTTPAIRALRDAYPGARLTVILRRELVPLAEGNPCIDEVLAFRSGGVWRKAAFLATLLRRRWDLWVDLHVPTFNTFGSNDAVFRRNALMLRAARARFRLGYAAPALAPHLTHPVAVPGDEVFAAENIVASTLRIVGASPDGARKELPPATGAARAAASALLGADARPLVGLFFGSNQPAGVWPRARVAALCAALPAALPGHRFALLGGPGERADIDAACAGLDGPFLDLVGRCGLATTAEVMRRCAAVVATDSGPMHMADALGVPLVALFGAKNPLPLWLPLSPAAVVLHRDVDCRRCLLSVCPRGNLCMELIPPADVIDALRERLAI